MARAARFLLRKGSPGMRQPPEIGPVNLTRAGPRSKTARPTRPRPVRALPQPGLAEAAADRAGLEADKMPSGPQSGCAGGHGAAEGIGDLGAGMGGDADGAAQRLCGLLRRMRPAVLLICCRSCRSRRQASVPSPAALLMPRACPSMLTLSQLGAWAVLLMEGAARAAAERRPDQSFVAVIEPGAAEAGRGIFPVPDDIADQAEVQCLQCAAQSADALHGADDPD